MLPDGKILIVGGVGEDGQIVETAEVFDTEAQTSEALHPNYITPRVYHTATLLTEGLLLIAGGLSRQGDTLNKAELWDFRSRVLLSANIRLRAARYNHSATLLPNGNVLLWGGLDDKGTQLNNGEQYRSARDKGKARGAIGRFLSIDGIP